MGRVPDLSFRTWVGYGSHKRSIRGHGSDSRMDFTCYADNCFLVCFLPFIRRRREEGLELRLKILQISQLQTTTKRGKAGMYKTRII